MKKLFGIILIVVLVCSLVACGGDGLYDKTSSTSASETAATEAYGDLSTYSRDIAGLETALVDRKLLTEDMVKNKVEMAAAILGATSGYRYTINNDAFVEIYECDIKGNATADELKSNIDREGTFSIADMDPLTGVYSKDGKFLLVYNAKIKYDGYEAIAKVIKEF